MSVSAARSTRVGWADTAKGVCILLVVLWHVVAKQYLRVEWPEGLRIPGAWGTLGELLLPLRMPLFFTISGMFALGAVNRSWRMSARPRVGKFVYLNVVWLLIHTTVLSLTPEFPTDRATSPLGLLEQLTITPSNLWYLYALALYFVIAKLTRRFPRLLVLGCALALSIAASAELIPVPGNRAGLLQNLVFFLAGLYFRPFVERLAATANWPRLALSVGVYAAALLAMAATGTQDVPGVWPAVCVTAAAFGVIGAAMLSRWDAVAAPLRSIGRQTLPIYVMHMPLLALLDLALAGPLGAAAGPVAVVLAIVEPILLTAFLTWICLVLHRGLEALGVSRVLLDLPGGGTAKHASRPAVTPEAPEPVPAHAAAQPVTAAQPVATAQQPAWSAEYDVSEGYPPPDRPASREPAWSPEPAHSGSLQGAHSPDSAMAESDFSWFHQPAANHDAPQWADAPAVRHHPSDRQQADPANLHPDPSPAVWSRYPDTEITRPVRLDRPPHDHRP